MWTLRTFGRLALETEAGEPVEALAGHTKALALLAYLAARAPDGPVPREDVAALFWPERSDAKARNALRVTLTRLRQATDGTLLGGKGRRTLWINRDELRADVARFREAVEAGEDARALDLYGGDYLAGVRIDGGSRFERWADDRRSAFRRQACEAALSLARSARAAGDLVAAETRFRQALDLAPLKEEAAEGLIRTLADRERPSDAIRLYQSYRERYAEQLDLAPPGELKQLVERIRSRRPPKGVVSAPEGRGQPERGARHDDGTDGDDGRRMLLGWASRPVTSAAAVLLLVALGAVVWYGTGPRGATDESAPSAAAGGVDLPTVAVLPFERLGGSDEAQPALEGLHTDLLTRLSNVGGLEVVSRRSVKPYARSDLGIAAIADSLGAEWVVEGGVQQVEDRLRVNVQLIDPDSDTHRWAGSYERGLTATNLFAIQTEIAENVARSLRAELSPTERKQLQRQPTGDLQAHRLYSQGRGLLQQRTGPTMRRAAEKFRRAIGLDSANAIAWAGLGHALGLLGGYGHAGADTVLSPARDAALRALELNPDLAEAHAALSRVHFYERRGPAALQRVERALDLRPSYALAHELKCIYLLTLGRPEAAAGSSRSTG